LIKSVANFARQNSAARSGDIVAPPPPDHESGEDRLIARYLRPLATHPGAFGLIDDAAAIAPPAGCDLVLKTDGVISGVHFFPNDPADTIAKKVLRMNLSDLAAKGARPLGFLLALALPNDIEEAWLAAFAEGLRADIEFYGCPLLGGDTDRTPGPTSVSVAAIGTVPNGTMIRRSGAKIGDRIVVTGTIGDAALGLKLRQEPDASDRWRLTGDMREHLAERYLLPRPRNAIADALRHHASAAMDVSDGLVGDLNKLCRASKVSADIEIERVPLSPAAIHALNVEPQLIETILTGGDDYEIIATIPITRLAALQAEAAAAAVPVTEIGHVALGESGAQFRDADGKAMVFKHSSFSHF
jgi:thiamine-monophosphate kinase